MNSLARAPEAAALAPRADGEDLGQDRERRLARRRRAEVEPGGPAQTPELLGRAALSAQALAALLLGPPRAHGPDAEGAARERAPASGHASALALDLMQAGPGHLAVRRDPALTRAIAVDHRERDLGRFRIGKLVL